MLQYLQKIASWPPPAANDRPSGLKRHSRGEGGRCIQGGIRRHSRGINADRQTDRQTYYVLYSVVSINQNYVYTI